MADLQAAWRDPKVDAVTVLVVVGAVLVFWKRAFASRRAKWAWGFYNGSLLLPMGWLPGALHGSSGGAEEQWQRTVDLLTGCPVAPLQGRGVRPGQSEGPLVVTNLTVATHLIGTRWMPDLRGSILVFEDVGEAPYRVDRMLTHWRTAGLLQGLAGVACGRFSWAENDVLPGDFSMDEILEERLGDLGIPLVLDLPVGHGRPNLALPIGAQARLDGRRGVLSCCLDHRPRTQA